MATLVLARETHKENRSLTLDWRKVETRLQGELHLTDAKAILMKTHLMSDVQAYDLIREQAMRKRTTIEVIAATIVNANEVLLFDGQ